ncbi:uncharacterized protein TRIADDRAFT_62224 [Trichoplax adhaerens]|uniref:PNPLA domain-containing protein n=1 Tax=Trichoplax adhaerens TaxID=10228 RepID=B3SD66_TRIAD|nr:hypothetical protein TRIADDRAFT_62224 [Trichoplax adhaerens]EDV19326.1 hypothetical protein TRIADDRAFT_62224 [Trichoplax adhaerens]|eukprot:XP_002118177.1 hypothetical protein TRIADDRAFT_62224 [Trichoplax adhaerens]
MHKSQGDKYLQRLIEWQNEVKDQFQRLRVLKPEDYKGDIIAPGLTIPKCRWNCNPKYQAADILSLYRDELHDIFRKRPALHILFNFKSHNYSGTRLKDKFDSYFGDIKLSEPLVDIDQEYGNEAYEYDAKPSKVFIDGKVHANNPAGYCYKYALDQGIKKENIYMSSLGTGDCVDGILWPKKTPRHDYFVTTASSLNQLSCQQV